MTRRWGGTTAALALAVVACATGLREGTASAAGLEYASRGVRPLGRGGAFVAGADDGGAVYYNPAGLIDAGSSILFDASWVNFSSEYTRKSNLRQVDPNTGETVGTYERTFPTVDGSTPFLPIPTLVGTWAPHRDVVLALGAYAPYSALTSYPEEVDGQPAPQRYSLYSLEGSLLAVLGLWGAYAPIDQIRIGAGFNALVGNFRSTLAFSGCLPDRFFCSPENPFWDVEGEIAVGPIFAPSANVGVIVEPIPDWRLGVSFQGPFAIDAPATLRTRLPQAPPFAEAEQVGENATVKFDLPWALRLGVETRAIVPELRLEIAFDYSAWSTHDRIEVEPDGIYLSNIATLPTEYYIPPVAIERGFQDAIGVRVGGEYAVKATEDLTLDLRAGLSYETSGIEPEYLTVLTIDANKVTPSIGAGLHVEEDLRFDFVFAYVIAETVEVGPDEGRVTQVVPVLANPSESPDIVNGGTYASRALILGLGVVYTFDRPRVDAEDEPAEMDAAPAPAKDPDPKPDPDAADEDADADEDEDEDPDTSGDEEEPDPDAEAEPEPEADADADE